MIRTVIGVPVRSFNACSLPRKRSGKRTMNGLRWRSAERLFRCLPIAKRQSKRRAKRLGYDFRGKLDLRRGYPPLISENEQWRSRGWSERNLPPEGRHVLLGLRRLVLLARPGEDW